VNEMDLATLALQEYTAGIRSESGLVSGSNQSNGTSNKTTLRRCRTREQGVALMTVGHAIEYLVDSRLVKQQNTTGAEREALAILLNANLSVYNEGTEIRPLASRLREWFRGGSLTKPETANASS
jgi:hypothetical protein